MCLSFWFIFNARDDPTSVYHKKYHFVWSRPKIKHEIALYKKVTAIHDYMYSMGSVSTVLYTSSPFQIEIKSLLKYFFSQKHVM